MRCLGRLRKKPSEILTKATVQLIEDQEYLAISNDGKSALISTEGRSGIQPTYNIVASLGACAASVAKNEFEKSGKNVKSLITDVESDIVMDEKQSLGTFYIAFSIESDDLNQQEIDKIVKKVEENPCPVARTLENPPVIKYIR